MADLRNPFRDLPSVIRTGNHISSECSLPIFESCCQWPSFKLELLELFFFVELTLHRWIWKEMDMSLAPAHHSVSFLLPDDLSIHVKSQETSVSHTRRRSLCMRIFQRALSTPHGDFTKAVDKLIVISKTTCSAKQGFFAQ